ncbi:hypothetical protein BH11ACT3_BH11ACT3_20140 [soil metagenome]
MTSTNDAHAETPTDEAPPTTTHSEWGAGRPRLIFNIGSEQFDGSPAREFDLIEPITTIGSAESCHLQLDGLDPSHARIVHEGDDEYVLVNIGAVELGWENTDDSHPSRHVLRSGAKLGFGEWSLFFTRDEDADHGRPFGGRVGGELAVQQQQPERPDYSPVE